jgi:hypothetical protein
LARIGSFVTCVDAACVETARVETTRVEATRVEATRVVDARVDDFVPPAIGAFNNRDIPAPEREERNHQKDEAAALAEHGFLYSIEIATSLLSAQCRESGRRGRNLPPAPLI